MTGVAVAVGVLQPDDKEFARKEKVMMTRCNVGGYDRAARLALGMMLMAAGLGLAVSQQLPRAGLIVTAVGFALVISGAFRFCLLYVPFGISTFRERRLE